MNDTFTLINEPFDSSEISTDQFNKNPDTLYLSNNYIEHNNNNDNSFLTNNFTEHNGTNTLNNNSLFLYNNKNNNYKRTNIKNTNILPIAKNIASQTDNLTKGLEKRQKDFNKLIQEKRESDIIIKNQKNKINSLQQELENFKSYFNNTITNLENKHQQHIQDILNDDNNHVRSVQHKLNSNNVNNNENDNDNDNKDKIIDKLKKDIDYMTKQRNAIFKSNEKYKQTVSDYESEIEKLRNENKDLKRKCEEYVVLNKSLKNSIVSRLDN
eukprot:TRINITY_DN13831_c0_g1_i1.p1 TRINITY_DN13831_c0_g1~~TRINITY_DN13831_c0_g1_i1.p1  ORF type:complete len:269 (-),score=55.10 TRINITY_DN13831_c0_g1_i1:41-847(-)